MFLNESELRSVIYSYQLNEILEISEENDTTDIVLMAISAAVEEMKSYLSPNDQSRWNDGRKRYDVVAIFSTTEGDRNPLILELCKNIALWYVCRLANVDIIHEKVKEGYDRAIDWLEKVSGTGKSSGAPALSPDLPTIIISEDNVSDPYRFGSRDKFSHE